jgi:Glycosyltransferase family 87
MARIIGREIMSRFWNEKRLQNYPRLIFIGIWIAMILNLALHRGWSGGFGGVIGVDFISYYSGGLLYRNEINNLYSIPTQYDIQQAIFQQEAYTGQYNTFISPPYVALQYALFTYLPIGLAFFLWTLLSIGAGLLSVFLIEKYLLPISLKLRLSFFQLCILVFGFPPVVLGLMFGQNHLITFLLLTVVVILSLNKRWLYAGIVLGLLIYKPHLVIGFLIVYLLRKRISALLGFCITSVVLILAVVLQHGIQPFINFMDFINTFVNNHYDLLMVKAAVFTLITSILYTWVQKYINLIMPYWILVTSGLLSLILLIKRVKSAPYTDYILATLSLFIISPHILIYDMLPLVLVIILLANEKPSSRLVILSGIIFVATVTLAILSKYVGIALLGLIPLYLGYLIIRNLVLLPKGGTSEFLLI